MSNNSLNNETDWLSSLMNNNSGTPLTRPEVPAPPTKSRKIAEPAAVVAPSIPAQVVPAPAPIAGSPVNGRQFDAAASVYLLPGELKAAPPVVDSPTISGNSGVTNFEKVRRLATKLNEFEAMRKVFSTVFSLTIFAAGVRYGTSLVERPTVETPAGNPNPQASIDLSKVNVAPKPLVKVEPAPAPTPVPAPKLAVTPPNLYSDLVRIPMLNRHSNPWSSNNTGFPTPAPGGLNALSNQSNDAVNKFFRDVQDAKKALAAPKS